MPEASQAAALSNRSALRYRRVLLKLSGRPSPARTAYRSTPRRSVSSPRKSRKFTRSGASSPSSSVAATSCAVCRRASTGSTARPATTWACWRPWSTPRPPGRAREAGRDDAGDVGDRDAPDRRALHPAACHSPSREGSDRRLRCRNRQPLFHDRHGRESSRHGDRRRGHLQGDAGRRRFTTPIP